MKKIRFMNFKVPISCSSDSYILKMIKTKQVPSISIAMGMGPLAALKIKIHISNTA